MENEQKYIAPDDDELVVNSGSHKAEVQEIILQDMLNEIAQKRAAFARQPNTSLAAEISILEDKITAAKGNISEIKLVKEEKTSDLRHEII